MTTTPVLTTTANEIVEAALRLIGEIDANQPIESEQANDGLQALNFLVKSYQSQGLHLWTKVEAILFTDVGKKSYFLGPGGDECCNEDDFVNTQLSVAGVALDQTISVDSSALMTLGDVIGVRLDDGTRQWTTILSIPSTTSVKLTTALTGAAAIDNSVFTFTSLIPRPMRILQLRRDKIGNTDDEIESLKWSRDEYFAQPNKSSQGDLVNWYYTPELTKGRLYVWQTSNDADKVARFTYSRPIDVTNDTADAPDFPSEWFRMLKYNLAVEVAPEYKVPINRLEKLELKANELLEDALGYDVEDDSMSLQPDME